MSLTLNSNKITNGILRDIKLENVILNKAKKLKLTSG